MTPEELKKRTKLFALLILKVVKALPKCKESDVIGYQILKAGTSVGANYRATCRSRSPSDFVSKITVVEEEADESAFWLELIIESGLLNNELVHSALKEADELTAIFTSSGNTAKGNLNK
ncbi:MAG: four helix bundle protein [Bacteroidetes bacterium]|nr:four helix bundle protein [Bacteroidota bacterium]